MKPIDLRYGGWQEALADVSQVDAIITDPPYSERTHSGHNRVLSGGRLPTRRTIDYSSWTPEDVAEFVEGWAPRCRGWFVALTSHDLWGAWERELERAGRYVFQPIPIVIPGMSVRLSGDGPSSWAIWAAVARPRTIEFSRWGTLPGAYWVRRHELSSSRTSITGGKPEILMRALVRDYSRRGDLVCDPCAGGATTLLAAMIEGRRAIGAEIDQETFEFAEGRLAQGYTPSFDFGEAPAELAGP